MAYSIGQVAKQFNLSVSTLRYYDKEGLFPALERNSGIRRFSEQDLETLRVIECLKKSGLEIKTIRQFMQWCVLGSETYQQRHQLFLAQQKKVEEELKHLKRVHDMLTFKCWYYEQLLAGEKETDLKDLSSAKMPKEIKKAYKNAHKQS